MFYFVKVHKQGIALGRSVDLSKFQNYEELIAELDMLFEFNGELMAPKKDWLIVYTDDENDMMLVGDDPWQYVFAVFSIFSIRQCIIFAGLLNLKTDEMIIYAQGVLLHGSQDLHIHERGSEEHEPENSKL